MTTSIITSDAHELDPDSGLILLYELSFNGSIFRFHSENTEENIRFGPEIGSDAASNTFTAFPIGIEGIEVTSDGAQPRPSLIIPNVNSLFRGDSDIPLSNLEDLIGSRVTLRKTLSKYVTVGSGAAPANNYEFPKSIYVIDRVASKNSLAVQFELASPFDLAGVRVPSRQVTGKYCPWYYKGFDEANETDVRSACSWSSTVTKSGVTLGTSSFDMSTVAVSSNYNGAAGTYTAVKDNSLSKGIPCEATVTTTGSGQNTVVQSINITNGGNFYNPGDRVSFNASDLGNNLGTISIKVTAVTREDTKLFFTIDDEPLVVSAATDIVNATTYNESTIYPINTIVKLGAGTAADPFRYFMSKAEVPTGNTPINDSIFWKAVRIFSNYNADKTAASPPTYYVYPQDPRKNSYVYHNNQVWRAVRQHVASASIEPVLGSLHWTPADVCSKLLSGCKARYQGIVHKHITPAGYTKVGEFDTSVPLPFGGFPGARNFR